MSTEAAATPNVRAVRIPDRHIQKLALAMACVGEATTAMNDAQRIFREKQREAQRAVNARSAVMELVYEIVGAPPEGEVDLQAGVIRWTEHPEATPTAPVQPPAALPTSGLPFASEQQGGEPEGGATVIPSAASRDTHDVGGPA